MTKMAKQRMGNRVRSLLAATLAVILAAALSPLAPAAAQEALTVGPLAHDEQVIAYAYLDTRSSTLSIEAAQRDESQAGDIYLGPVYDTYDSADELPWNKMQYSGSPYNISTVIIGEGVAPRSTAYWFDRQGNDYFTNFSIDMSAMDVSRWESAKRMLYWSYAQRVVFPQGTADKLTDMSGMLRGAVALVDFDQFYAPNVEDVGGLFASCFIEGPISVANLGANGTITSVETEIITGVPYPMFDLCQFTEIDLTGFRVASSTDTTNLLRTCHYMEKVTLDGALGGSNSTIILPSKTYAYDESHAARTYSGENLKWVRQSDGEVLDAGAAIPTNVAATYTRQLGDPDSSSSQPTQPLPEEEATDIHAVVDAKGHMTVYAAAPASVPDDASVWYTKGSPYWQGGRTTWLSSNGLAWYDCAASVTSASFDSSLVPSGVAPESTAYWFYNCKNLVSIDFGNLDAASVKDMSNMFAGCESLASLNLSGFEASNVEKMSWAFAHCNALETLDLSGIGTRSTDNPFPDLKYISANYSKLRTVKVGSGFQPNGWSLPAGIWQASDGSAYRPEQIPFGKAETYTRVSNKPSLFYSLDNEGTLTLATARSSLPSGGPSEPLSVAISGYGSADALPWHARRDVIKRVVFQDTGADELDCSYWFAGCRNLASVDLGGIRSLRDGIDMFRNCTALRTVDLSGVDCSADFEWLMKDGTVEYASTLTDPVGMYAANFARFTKDYSGMFDGCRSLTGVTFPAGEKAMRPTSLARMFRGCMALEAIDLSRLDTSTTVDFSEMFRECRALASLDLSAVDSRNARSMSRMLHGCRALRAVTVGEDVSFFGATTARLAGCEFPNGVWQGTKQASTETILSETPGNTPEPGGGAGSTAYASDSIPSFVADTYTRVDDPAGYTIVSLFDNGIDRYGLEAVIGENDVKLTYDLSTYNRDTLTVGADVEATTNNLISEAAVKAKTITLYGIKGDRTVTTVILSPKVKTVAARTFAGTNVRLLIVLSPKLTTKASVKNCLTGSSINKVTVRAKSNAAKVRKAFESYSGKKAKVS